MSSAWETKQLADVAELQGRIGWKGLTAKEYTPEGPYFLSVHALNHGDFVDFRDAFHISQERYHESPEIMLRRDDVLICKDGAGIGKVGIVGEMPGPSTINSSLLLIRAKPNILPKYLYLILQSPYFQEIVQSRLEGATTPHLYQRDIATFPIRLPPLEEQRRIVAMLDEAFAAIATATANAEENLANAREFFQATLALAFQADENNGQKSTWQETTLGELCHVARGGSPRPIKSFLTAAPDGINWIKIGDATAGDGKYIATTREKIRPEGLKMSRLVEPGDFLLSNSMSFGRPYIMRTRGCIHDGWLVLRDKSDRFDPDFLYYFLSSDAAYRQFDALAAGSTVRNLNSDLVRTVKVALPPFEVQRQLVKRFDELSSQLSQFRNAQKDKLVCLGALKQSLLHRAFSGELTEREPLAA